MKKTKSLAILLIFGLTIFGLLAAFILIPDAEISRAERRKLQQKPELSTEAVLSGKYMEDLEAWMLDQFPLRDSFRRIKAGIRFDLMKQLDNNGVYLVGDGVYKLEYPLREEQVNYAAEKISSLCAGPLAGMNVYCAVVPDKNWYVAEKNGYPHLDYDRMTELLLGGLPGDVQYVDLFGLLTEEDYYRTDTHWRQEEIFSVAETLASAMNAQEGLIPASEWTPHTLSPFYGVYCGQSALSVTPDTLTYLTSPATDSAVVTGAEFEGTKPVYDLERFDDLDGYDVFLSGAQAVLTVECAEAKTGRELILFRDSFGSSLAPLLLGAYDKITLVDLRYISSSFLESFVDFENQDVLFLYSTSLLNSAMLLK
ncbi:MAG: DHHW family protein [Eubacteriales bacterium]|nr:DHHW family protein [Eubacteriales bacterium]